MAEETILWIANFNVFIYSGSTYQKVALVSLCSTTGAAGTGTLLDPLGLDLAAVPTPAASLLGEKGCESWLLEP